MTNNQNLDLLLAEIELLKSDLVIQDHDHDAQLLKNLDIEYCYESNRLEGNSLSFRENQMVIGLGLSGRPMVENLAALNHYEAIKFIRAQATEQTLLSESLLTQLHVILSRAIPRKNIGQYRDEPCLITGTDYPAPAPEQLVEQIAADFQWLRLEGPFLHPVIFAAETHLRLQMLQPFNQANGLCARLVMNLILLSEGYPIANIRGDDENRMTYQQTLASVVKTGDKMPWFELIAKQVMHDSKSLLTRLKQFTG